jgi:hypothetical protein
MTDHVTGQTPRPTPVEDFLVDTKVDIKIDKAPRDAPREKKRGNVGPYKLDRRIEGGKAECWFCVDTRDGSKKFLKKFPSPKMPSAEERAYDRPAYDLQVEQCELFLQHHQSVALDLTNERVGNGSLVRPLDSFWHESSFFKIYPYLDDLKPLNFKNVNSWNSQQRLLAIRSIFFAMRELHNCEIVHADIKLENIHLVEVPSGLVARLIDFDDSYRVESPPPASVLGGTEDFYSPEVLVHKRFAESSIALSLGMHSDLFSLSLALHEAFSPRGIKPRWSGDEADAGFHALAGDKVNYESLGTGKSLLEYRLRKCLSLDPAERPRISELLSACGTNLGCVA